MNCLTLLRLAPAVACVLGIVLKVESQAVPAAEPGKWQAEVPMKHARASHAVVATEDSLYAIGGIDGEAGPVLAVERFDGTAWVDETSLPGEGLNAPAAAALGSRIFIIGGFGTSTNVPTAEVRVYDTVARAWGKAADLPAPRGGHAAVVLLGKIHVIGGGNSRSTIADHSVYDPVKDAWTDAAPLPRAEGSTAAVVWGGKLYAIGGRSGRSDFGDVYVYDAAADAWAKGPEILPRATCGAVAYRGEILLIGGEVQARSEVTAEAFSLAAGAAEWERGVSMPTARSFARAVVFKDAVWVVGGSPEPQRDHAPKGLATVESFRMSTEQDGRDPVH